MFRVGRSGRAGALPGDDLEGVPDRDGFGQFPGPNAFETAELIHGHDFNPVPPGGPSASVKIRHRL